MAGRTYTFSPAEEISQEAENALLDSLAYCGEFELIKTPG